MTQISSFHLTGADILREGALQRSDISITDTMFSDTHGGPQIDLTGYYLLPGIIDLHGDAFERHLAPRPSAPFDPEIGLRSTERELLANGVTTAYLAQSWSWEGGFRSPEATEALMEAVANYRPQMVADMRVQVRFEYYLTGDGDRLLAAADAHDVDYIVFNNHLDEGLAMAETKPAALANWAAQNKRTARQHLQLMRETKAYEPEVAQFITRLGAEFVKRGIESGSHDDTTPEHRSMFDAIGARMCEFPTNMEAATKARELDNPILMGAPNVVRGGSQSGNIAAVDLIEADLCDVLVSDYYAPALATAAWSLVDSGRMPLSRAWAMISTNAATAKRFGDRGQIAAGYQADAAIINKATRQIEGTIGAGRIGFATGQFVDRLLSHQIRAQSTAA